MGLGSALGSVVGSAINSATSIWATNKSNKASKHSSQAQMKWEEKMSNTAHQREMADLKKAGLNPVLAANNGASTPGGASYTADTANLSPGSDTMSAYAQLKQIKLMEAQKGATEAGEKNTDANTNQTEKMTPQLIAESQTRQAANIASANQAQKQAESIELQNQLDAQEVQWRKDHPWLYAIERGSQSFGGATAAIGNLAGIGLGWRRISSAEKMAMAANASRERIADQHERARENERRGYKR